MPLCSPALPPPHPTIFGNELLSLPKRRENIGPKRTQAEYRVIKFQENNDSEKDFLGSFLFLARNFLQNFRNENTKKEIYARCVEVDIVSRF